MFAFKLDETNDALDECHVIASNVEYELRHVEIFAMRWDRFPNMKQWHIAYHNSQFSCFRRSSPQGK